jgi:L-asparaginase II
VNDSVLFARTVHGSAILLEHWGHLVVSDEQGKALFVLGDRDHFAFARSTIKPFRALAGLRNGLGEFELGPEELALVAGSHSGTRYHRRLVVDLLARHGMDESCLQCGISLPVGEDGTTELLSGEIASPSINGCSGEHAAAILLTQVIGSPTASYLEAESPTQKLLNETIEEMLGKSAIVAVDGCGMPTSAWTLSELAKGWSNLLKEIQSNSVANVLLDSIRAAPQAYAGKNRIVTSVLEASNGRIVGKDGAHGLYLFYDTERKLSIAVKMTDGSRWPAIYGIRHALQMLNALDEAEWPASPGTGFGTLTAVH